MKALIGIKMGMTKVFDNRMNFVPVTVIKVDRCWITGIKKQEKHGYDSIQLGYGLKLKNIKKPYKSLFRDVNKGEVPLLIKEFSVNRDDVSSYSIGQEITVDVFNKGDYVDVTGISKGKGYAGVMKRHNFNGLPASHGNGEYRRRSGSLSASSYPSRVFKGIRMAGHCGVERVTVQKLEVVDVILDDNVILLKGAVPGINGGYIQIKETIKSLKKKKEIKEINVELKLNKKR